MRAADLVSKIFRAPNPQGSCIVKTIHGLLLLVNPIQDKGLEKSVYFQGTYEEGTLSIMSLILKKGETFVDIGANIGLMSLHAAKILSDSGRVLSFEPLKSTFEILVQNIKLNKFRNIEAVNIAIGSTNGTVYIFDYIAKTRGSSSLIKSSSAQTGHRIPIYSLDRYLKEHYSGCSIDCIKIDVEGWELEVLKGASTILSTPDSPICIIECSTLHPIYGGNIGDIYRFLRNFNSYRIFRLARGKERPSKLVEIVKEESLPRHDNLFCFLPNHLNNLPKSIFHTRNMY